MTASPLEAEAPAAPGLRAALHRHRLPLVLVALVATIVFLPPLLRREVFTLRDHFDYFQPLRFFTAEELKAGRLPLWNPYSASGEPWLANPQTGVFYPPSWLFLAIPFATAYMLFLLVHLLALGWGAYLLFARRASQGAALVGAVAVMFSGPVLSLLDVSNNFATFAWIPLALWCACSGAWRRGGIVLALAFLGGEPFFAALAALMYVVIRRNRDVIGTAAIAVGVSAIQLLPFLEFVSRSDRTGSMNDALILRHSMPLRDWLRVAVPPGASGITDPHLGQHFIPIIYMGISVVVLAAVGVVAALRRGSGDPSDVRAARREVGGWALLLVTAAAIATGPSIVAHLPVTLFRYPARMVPFGALAVAGLAVAGWDRIRPGRRWLDLVIVLVVIADLLPRARPLLLTAPFRKDVVPWAQEIGMSSKVLRFGDIDPGHRAAWISGYLNLYDRRFDVFTAAPLANEGYVRMYRDLLQKPTFESFANAGVAFILAQYDLPKPWRLVAGAEGVQVYQNGDAFPMAAHFSPGSPSIRRGSWTLDTSRAHVTLNAARDGVLVLRQQAAPGWRVTVDGMPAKSLVIDGIYRGVDVPRGHHEIEWTYRPLSFFAGAAMTFLTLLTMQITLFVKRGRRR